MARKNPKTPEQHQRDLAYYRTEKGRAYKLRKMGEYRQRNAAFVRTLKSATPCTDCGRLLPYYCMDFDHLADKEAVICQLVHRAVSLDRLKAEIAKCEVVCAVCHRIRTFERAALTL